MVLRQELGSGAGQAWAQPGSASPQLRDVALSLCLSQ